jgi:hypothetical protein
VDAFFQRVTFYLRGRLRSRRARCQHRYTPST